MRICPATANEKTDRPNKGVVSHPEFGKSRKKPSFLGLGRQSEEVVLPQPPSQAIL